MIWTVAAIAMTVMITITFDFFLSLTGPEINLSANLSPHISKQKALKRSGQFMTTMILAVMSAATNVMIAITIIKITSWGENDGIN